MCLPRRFRQKITEKSTQTGLNDSDSSTHFIGSLGVLSSEPGLLQRLNGFAVVWVPGPVTYHRITNHLKEAQGLAATQTIRHVAAAVGPGFGCGLAGWFWPGASRGLS